MYLSVDVSLHCVTNFQSGRCVVVGEYQPVHGGTKKLIDARAELVVVVG